ncbi:MAG TPA: uracil-DNA glycosylase [Candidatus Saccharimonadales bacterium]|nr:uracil-DNA glycosylase [Candidatus Saccharimonadales bacterium]
MTKEEALAEVAKRIAACERCKYVPNQNPVPGEGNPDAEIMFVGEAPGKKENETGRPFIGAAGKFLEEMLNSIGLERSGVFIANAVKYQPPGNRDPLPDEISLQLPFLLKQIAIIKPKLIVFLGRHALSALLPDEKRTITQLHGQLIMAESVETVTSTQSPVASRPLAYLPLYHPAAALYNGSMRQVLLDDFAKIPGYMDEIAEKA